MSIVLKNVSKKIKGISIIDDISYVFEYGKIYGFQGKNGSGKTMLMRVICGLIHLSSGEVLIDGKVLNKDIDFPPSLGALIENPSFLSGYTGKQNLRLIAGVIGNISEYDIIESLVKVGLDPDDTRIFKRYSLGMKQRLGIANAIMGAPRLIILDEPINALDEDAQKSIKHILDDLKAKGSCIIISCHDREELNLLSDVIVKISDGKIIV